ncbi:peptidoglycan DD-metalloendopeptidase family protein [Streptomyces sp. NPDC058284]|uniref:peptidoglycan DD-metalloendopeptidase family protein n=1 Tax=unclassified Streptomyces TaxID=2593676 RepID=UPI00364EB93F
MNDRHPSGSSTPPSSAPGADYAHYAPYDQQSAQHGGYDSYSTGAYDTGTLDTGTFDTGTFATDPLFGDLPGGRQDTGQWATTTGPQQTLTHDAYAAQYYAATYDGGGHGTGGFDTGSYETGSCETGSFDTGSFDTASMWATGGHRQLVDIPSQPGPEPVGQWDTAAWDQGPGAGQWDTQTFDTGAYDATTWNSADEAQDMDPSSESTHPEDDPETDPNARSASPDAAEEPRTPGRRASRGKGSGTPGANGSGTGSGSRTRRRSPAKRSALLTVAVPSACVMGVAGVAAASVGNFGGDETKDTTASAPDPTSVQPSAANNKLDTQLANLSADAGDFADRASRTQERIDLKAQKVAAQKKAAAEAARKERLRPKFVLPVKQHGLSAYYGQAGVNWMSAHSGIDFPVSYGTEVLAATDGTVSTKWNSAYGNMAIVTAKDGTETWYCHLSTHKISSGPVKAGEPIAFSGNSGNSTGPHLHFEVRPGGGSAIDPLPWLRSHGLDPT